MLRIDIGSFPRRDAKKLRIELIDVGDEPAALGDRFAGHTRLRIIVTLNIPAIGWNIDNTLTTFDKKFPQRVEVVHAAGEVTADSNDCDSFFLHGRGLLRRGGLISVAGRHVK